MSSKTRRPAPLLPFLEPERDPGDEFVFGDMTRWGNGQASENLSAAVHDPMPILSMMGWTPPGTDSVPIQGPSLPRQAGRESKGAWKRNRTLTHVETDNGVDGRTEHGVDSEVRTSSASVTGRHRGGAYGSSSVSKDAQSVSVGQRFGPRANETDGHLRFDHRASGA